MDTTLIINPGSSSKKFALYNGMQCRSVMRFERTEGGYAQSSASGTLENIPEELYENALGAVLRYLEDTGSISSPADITRVGVRIVAPGSYFQTHRIVTDAYRTALAERVDAAPLHVPAVLAALEEVATLLPDVQCIGVSDSAFHRTLPQRARRYSIPEADATEYDLYHFGYHGLSVASIARMCSEKNELPRRTVVCHIGSGVSVTALKEGVSVDTSMGFSPLSGVAMGTRAGDMDPGALLFLMKSKQFSVSEAYTYLYKKSGLYGLVGVSDLRVVIERAHRGDRAAESALAIYFYTIQKEIGACMATLGGLDLLVLTATAAERNPLVRAYVTDGLEGLGIVLDRELNNGLTKGGGSIGVKDSPVTIYVQPTDECGEMVRICRGFKA